MSEELEAVEPSGPAEGVAEPVNTEESQAGENPEEKQVADKISANDHKVINAKLAEQKRKLREAEARAQELEQRLQQQQPDQAPEVPDMPDRLDFDDDRDFERAVAYRDEKIRQSVEFEAQQQALLKQQQARQAELVRQQQEQQQQLAIEYGNRAVKLGVNAEELQAAGNFVGAYGLSDDVVNHILHDEHGPLITTYLAKNPLEMEQIATLDPVSAGIYIATQVKGKAAQLQPKVTSAPDPVDNLSGGGVPRKERGPSGAKFR